MIDAAVQDVAARPDVQAQVTFLDVEREVPVDRRAIVKAALASMLDEWRKAAIEPADPRHEADWHVLSDVLLSLRRGPNLPLSTDQPACGRWRTVLAGVEDRLAKSESSLTIMQARRGEDADRCEPTEQDLRSWLEGGLCRVSSLQVDGQADGPGATARRPMAAAPLEVRFTRLDPAAKAPHRGSAAAAGWDLHALVPVHLEPGVIHRIRTGLAVAIPSGHEGQVRARSGLASQGMLLPNGIGTIDADYRGELMVLAVWVGPPDGLDLAAGERIAQLVIMPVPEVTYSEVPDVADLGSTDRDQGGFGSSGQT